MSGWIKVEKELETDPRTLRMAKAVAKQFRLMPTDAEDDPCNAVALPGVTLVCGALSRLWIYADSHIRADNTLDMSTDEIDEWLGIPGFCDLIPTDWLVRVDDKSVELPGFLAHNGVEAKKKALTSKRVENHRIRAAVTECNADALPDQTRPDQTKPDSEESRDMSAAKRHDDVVIVFNHWCSTWNHPDSKLDDKRRARIEARLKRFTAEQLCDAISGFRNSDWHTGKDPKGGGKIYDKVETLLRDDSQVEEGMRLFASPPRPFTKADVRLQSNLSSADEFMRRTEPTDATI